MNRRSHRPCHRPCTFYVYRFISNIYLTYNKFCLNILPASVKFIQCQTVLRNALKTSPNYSIKELWKSTNNHTNIQYDIYNSTKEVLKDFHSGQEDKLQHRLICQGSFFSNEKQRVIRDYVQDISKFCCLWVAETYTVKVIKSH
jgi:hypothetical protein